ncbi:MAG: hypothetical protein ACYTFI_02475 [Planctomycetota bacterium]|jgi:hypothetical protein
MRAGDARDGLSRNERLDQTALVLASLALSWLAFQALHELGHCIGAWLTGGRIGGVALHPLVLSHTQLSHDPHPLLVAWSGPLGGITIPLAIWGAGVLARLRQRYLFRFFASFCLIANGAYVGLDAFVRAGDGREMILHGSPVMLLVAFGLAATAAGLRLWHGLGRHFGLGPDRARPERRDAAGVAIALVALVVAELVFFGRGV